MAKIPGTNYDAFVTTGQIINFGVTTDPFNPPAPIIGDFNLEVIVDATGTGMYPGAGGYDGLAVVSADGRTLTLSRGNFGVIDTAGSDNLSAGTGNQTIGGAAGDTIAGFVSTQFLDGSQGHQSIAGGSFGNETIWGGVGDTINGGSNANVTIGGAAGDTITGGSGNEFIDASQGHQSVTGGPGGSETIWSGAGDTIQGGNGGGETIGGVAGDTITGGFFGNQFVDASRGGQAVDGGFGANVTIWAGAGDMITGGSGNVTIGGVPGDTITGGSGNEFIDATGGNQSVAGGRAGNETIWGGAGDTITGGTGGNETIAGVAGETIAGGIANPLGNTFIDATSGNESIAAGSGNTIVWGQSGDTVQGAAGGGSAMIAFGAVHGAETLWDSGSAPSGNDSVYDFSQSIGDRISLSTQDSAATVVAGATSDSSGNVVIHLHDGASITLIGVSQASLSNGYFTTH